MARRQLGAARVAIRAQSRAAPPPVHCGRTQNFNQPSHKFPNLCPLSKKRNLKPGGGKGKTFSPRSLTPAPAASCEQIKAFPPHNGVQKSSPANTFRDGRLLFQEHTVCPCFFPGKAIWSCNATHEEKQNWFFVLFAPPPSRHLFSRATFSGAIFGAPELPNAPSLYCFTWQGRGENGLSWVGGRVGY